MPCFYPIPALADDGKVQLHPPLGSANLLVPCGGCLGCRVQKSQEWATRIMHEMQDHTQANFLTLTYDKEHCPRDLQPRDLELFLKRIRVEVARHNPTLLVNRPGSLYERKLRYFAVGEYGDRTERPHYHMVLFGCGFADEMPHGAKLKKSSLLDELWGHGAVRYGQVTHQSAAYVALYTRKKQGESTIYYDQNGEVRRAPFQRCSKHPGLGAGYASRNILDHRSGSTYGNRQVTGVPRYYRKLLEKHAPLVREECDQSIWQRVQDKGPESQTARARAARLVIMSQKFNRSIPRSIDTDER